MQGSARLTVIGVLCAVPVGVIAAWFAIVVLDPSGGGAFNSYNRSLGMGPYRGVWFALAPLLSAAVVGPRISREDVGGFGGFVRFIGLGNLLAFVGMGIELAVGDPGSLGSFLLASPLLLVILLGGTLVVWIPAAGVWVAAVRRLTIEDLVVPTDLERALSEQLRNAAAREHVKVDATNLADQGSRHYRNRG
ncbi:MAG: hypothetical protein M3P84_12235 [Chloroflexota bacterium]|nr:hypothetical protein [Chloroflexota bacterium]